MVIGHLFAWGHVPKTAGDYTLAMFKLFPNLIEHADAVDSHEKHALFTDRSTRVAGKQLALNIRRLPQWTLSLVHHRNRWGEYPSYEPLAMLSPFAMASQPFGDIALKDRAANDGMVIDRWLRAERLSEDFLEFISQFTRVSSPEREAVARLGRRNVGHYERAVAHWFTSDHIVAMYRTNPLWASVERRAYGDTLVEHLPLT
jgi:hypothetical protein